MQGESSWFINVRFFINDKQHKNKKHKISANHKSKLLSLFRWFRTNLYETLFNFIVILLLNTKLKFYLNNKNILYVNNCKLIRRGFVF